MNEVLVALHQTAQITFRPRDHNFASRRSHSTFEIRVALTAWLVAFWARTHMLKGFEDQGRIVISYDTT